MLALQAHFAFALALELTSDKGAETTVEEALVVCARTFLCCTAKSGERHQIFLAFTSKFEGKTPYLARFTSYSPSIGVQQCEHQNIVWNGYDRSIASLH